MLIMKWIIGLGFSLAVGHYCTKLFLKWLRNKYKVEKPEGEKSVPPWLTGLIERLFFTIAVAFAPLAAVTAMMAWLGIKTATHWARAHEIREGSDSRFLVFSSLLAGLVSMLFALIGGLIIALFEIGP